MVDAEMQLAVIWKPARHLLGYPYVTERQLLHMVGNTMNLLVYCVIIAMLRFGGNICIVLEEILLRHHKDAT